MIDDLRPHRARRKLRAFLRLFLLVAFAGLLGMMLLFSAGEVADAILPPEPTPVLEPLDFVVASVETEPVPSHGDAADDPAIWVHPTDPELSTIIGTDKRGGLAVYDLNGTELQYLAHGRLNNVDIRHDFPFGDERVALVTVTNRDDFIAIYKVNPRTRLLEDVAARSIPTGISAYGICMYHSPIDGRFYTFVNSEEGEIEQWELFATANGKVDARALRVFGAGGRTEGCVADDELSYLYIGVQGHGIWKFGAEPDAGASGIQVDKMEPEGHISSEVEGLTLYYGPNGSGYLVASSQIQDAFVIYRREGDNAYIMGFRVKASNAIDSVTHTDGIDASSANFGASFPEGLFVAQDHSNGQNNQNFKLVSWREIRAIIEKVQTASLQQEEEIR